jgi:arginine exporter protein ArgO
MFVRIFVTTALAVFGIYAFWSDALGAGHILNPFGIMFLLFAALVWFGWQTIREAFKSVKDESHIPILRMGSTIIKGMEDIKRSEHEYRRRTSK